jgi:hypothetical protein
MLVLLTKFTNVVELVIETTFFIVMEGLDRAKHRPSITEGDLERLRSSHILSTNNPKSLQQKVWFDIMLSFVRRVGKIKETLHTKQNFKLMIAAMNMWK